jgi:ABC-type nitrate/sulfonate/bicarbonate transport system permease component
LLKYKQETLSVLGSAGPKGILPFVGVILFITIWAIVSHFGLVNSLLLPTPLRVLGAIQDVGSALILHIGATLFRVCVGYTIGILIGISVGLLMQFDSRIYRTLDGLIETFRPVPPVAVVPFFILIFGFSEIGKILITVIGVGLLMTVTTIEAIERVPAPIIRWGLVVGLSRKDLFRFIVLPAAWPDLRAGFRLSMALAITLVIVSEFMGARYGLGYLISVSKVTLTTPTILLTTMILGWIGWGLDRAVRLLFDKTTAWDIRAKGAIR